jgi:drug/metabolite transporter (DMT)-like permease
VRPAWIAAALAVVYLAWGSTYLSIRVAIDVVPPFLMLSARFVIAGGLLWGWSRWRHPGAPLPTVRQWRTAGIIGAAFFVAGNGGVAWAEQHVPTGTVALIVAVIPVFMVGLDRILWKASLSGWTAAGMTLASVGVVGIVGTPSQGFPVWAALVPVAGALAWAAGSLQARGMALPDDPALGISMQMLVAAAGLAVLGLLSGESSRFDISAVTVNSILAVLYLAVVGSAVTFSLYFWLLRVAPTSLVGTYAFVNPIVAVGLGWLVLGESLPPAALLGAALTVAGVAVIVVSARRPALTPRHPGFLRADPHPVPAANR